MPVTATAAIATRNRNNAQHSTGPRTQQGKAASSQNARKHGFTVTGHQILATEDPAVYAAFEDEIITIYNPKSLRERLAAVEIAQCRWALRRFDEAEISLLDTCLCNGEQTPGEALGDRCITDPGAPHHPGLRALDLLVRYRRPWDRRHQQALREFNQARLDRNREERMAIAQQREACKQAEQQRKTAAREAQGQRETRNTHYAEGPTDGRGREAVADPLGFVSSPTTQPLQTRRHQAAADMAKNG